MPAGVGPRRARPPSNAWRQIFHRTHQEGSLVYGMQQGNLIRLSSISDEIYDEVKGGACFAISVHWLGLRLTNDDYDGLAVGTGKPFLERIPEEILEKHAKRAYDVMLHVPIQFNSVLQRPTTLAKKVTQILFFRDQRMKIVKNVVQRVNAANFLRNIKKVLDAHTGLYLVSMYRTGGGAHAIAMEQGPGETGVFRLFDPNFGHFKVSGRDTREPFLRDFMTRSGYLNRYNIQNFVLAEWDKSMPSVARLKKKFGG